MKYATYLFTLAFVLTVIACGGDDDESTPTCNTDNVTYNNTVKAIFDNAGCADNGICHNGQQANGFSLATYEDASNFIFLNRMVGSLRWQSGFSPMPKDSTVTTDQVGTEMLSDCDIDKIEAWILAGTPE
ncbi:MAG: hypothetical protein AAFZ15_16020 [Bacteroidota bacterium]